jgi:hypothetical protein
VSALKPGRTIAAVETTVAGSMGDIILNYCSGYGKIWIPATYQNHESFGIAFASI